MAKRSLQRTVSDLLLSALGMMLILAAIIVMFAREYPVQAGGLLLVGLAGFGWWKHASGGRNQRRRAVAQAVADRQIAIHRQALLSYFRQSIRTDLFGNEDISLWRRHIDTFLDSRVASALESASLELDAAMVEHLAKYVDRCVRASNAEARLSTKVPDIDVAQLSPREFEQHCASILFRCGWTVHPTPVTGDHGADVVAEKDGHRLIVQCKLYASPVGNKAVQEVYAARPLYNGTHACVVAPSGFTPQARRAAHALSVRLLRHSDLEDFARELATAVPSRRAASA
jgi:restriction system protein